MNAVRPRENPLAELYPRSLKHPAAFIGDLHLKAIFGKSLFWEPCCEHQPSFDKRITDRIRQHDLVIAPVVFGENQLGRFEGL